MLKLSLLILVPLSFLLGCSSKPVVLSNINVGMSKADVLEKAGNPSRSYRKDSVDHWVYNYYENNSSKTRTLLFREGKVISIGAESLKSEMQEYEKSLEKKPSKSDDFQDLD